MELIGEGKINDAFNAWLMKHNFEARIGGMDTDFYWKPVEDTISYSFVYAQKYDTVFQKVCEKLGLAYEIDIFWLSLLHELGHSETWHLVEEEHHIIDIETYTSEDYYYHPRELVATQWAVDFINEHFDWVQELMNMSRAAIIEFFITNDIEMEEE